MQRKLLQNITLASCILWLGYWLAINIFKFSDFHRNLFTDSYSVLPLLGAVYGFVIAKHWGGWHSYLGKAILLFSLGLLLQFFDQAIYTVFYYTTGNDLTFPNIGDVPYIFSGIAYSLAVLTLVKVLKPVGSRFAPIWVPLLSVVIGLAALTPMYLGFIRYGISDDRGTLYGVLNTVYPALQAVYFVLGVTALLQSRLVSKGIMFKPLLALIVALGVQFGADFVFLYQSYHDSWTAAGMSDLFYALAYVFLIAAIFLIDHVRSGLMRKDS